MTTSAVIDAIECAHCEAGNSIFGGGELSPPFHDVHTNDPGVQEDGGRFVECPRERPKWDAARRLRDAAPELLAAVREDAAGQPVSLLLRTAAAIICREGDGPIVQRLALAADAIDTAVAKAEGRQ